MNAKKSAENLEDSLKDEEEPAPDPGTPRSADEIESVPAGDAPEQEKENERDELAEKCLEVLKLQDEMLRLRAETDNYRRRLQKEKADTIRFSNERILKDLIPIYDNLNRALSASSPSVDSLKKGVEMIAKQFQGLLKKQHITPMKTIGEKFDPRVHEVLSQVESADHDDGTIIEEYSRGYTIHDRVLVPARVVTAKPPQANTPPAAEAPAEALEEDQTSPDP
ncbi:MAG: nucleotide exchange factor GrpE [Nitrospinaceae bacterium]